MDPKRLWDCADMSQVRSEILRIDAAQKVTISFQ